MNASFIPTQKLVQHADTRYIEITLAQLVANGNVVDIEVPENCQVSRGFLNVITPFNTTGTDTIKIGDSVDDDRHLAATSIKAAAQTGFIANIPFVYNTNGVTRFIRITRTPADNAATAGVVRVFIETIALGKSYYTQG